MLRILFVKTSSLGDVVHQCPALCDVAHHVRDAQVDWVVEESFAAVAEMHRHVRHVIPVAVRRWRKTLWRQSVWAEIAAFRRRVAEESYDIVIDSQGLLKSALISVLARGERHGLNPASAREPIAARFYNVTHKVQSELHPVERNRILAASALDYALDGSFDYGLLSSGESRVLPGAPYAVLLSMTSRREKLWPVARWIELALELGRRGLRVVLPYGAEAERRRSAQIAEKKAVVILQFLSKRAADLPDIPAAVEFAANEADRQLLNFAFGSGDLGRAILAPPGIEPERLKALRDAFDAAMRDPELLAEAAKARFDIDHAPAAELERLAREALATPPEIVERMRKITAVE